MPFKPSRLEARVALDGDHKELVKRQRTATTDDDPFGWLTSLIGIGDDDEETTTTRRTSSTTTTGRATLTTPTLTNTRTVSTPTPTPTPRTTAQVVTTPQPVASPSRQTTTITSTSTGFDSTQANANNGNNASSGGLPSVVIGIIVAASVIFGLILIALIARKVFQSRRRNRRNTWARNSTIAPFDAPTTEKALPPPPPMENPSYPVSYPAYPPAAVAPAPGGYSNIAPYSPAAPSSAGYPAPYPFGGPNAALLTPNSYQGGTTTAGTFNAADLAGPVVIQHTPPTPIAPVSGVAGTISIVKRTFVPSLPDELSISNGDQVRVLAAYDDGWALCEKVSTGDKGVVPQECLEVAKATGGDDTRLNRNSSLRRQAN